MIVNISNNRTAFISTLINLCGYTNYLELGIDDGNNISLVGKNSKVKCYGVDINQPSIIDGYTFYKMTTDDFFKSNKFTFDIIFIDACHNIDFVINDFENALKIINKNGVILLHDVDPINIDLVDMAGVKYSGNAYKVIDYIYVNHPDLNVLVLPIDETGIAMVNKKRDCRLFSYKDSLLN